MMGGRGRKQNVLKAQNETNEYIMMRKKFLTRSELFVCVFVCKKLCLCLLRIVCLCLLRTTDKSLQIMLL